MPGPLLTFEGNAAIPAVVSRVTATAMSARIITSKRSTNTIKIFDKNGNTLSGPTSYNSFFSGFDWHSLHQRERRRPLCSL